MPLARIYNPARHAIQSTLHDAYRDRLAKDSDIREYLPLLHDTAAGYPGVTVLELGTRKGNSTCAFLAAAEKTGGHVWSVDVDPVHTDPDGMGPWAACPLWTFTHGDDLHPAVRAKQPPEVDVLLVDTSHTYDQTLAEIEAYLPRVVPGGVALFHDTNVLMWRPGEKGSDEPPPVRRALDDYCAKAGITWEDLPGEYGMGVIHA